LYAGIPRPKSNADVPGCRMMIEPIEVYKLLRVLISYIQTHFVTVRWDSSQI